MTITIHMRYEEMNLYRFFGVRICPGWWVPPLARAGPCAPEGVFGLRVAFCPLRWSCP
ncbi:unnamed protein product [Prunus brigantina]